MSKKKLVDKFKEIDDTVKGDAKVIVRTLLHYFGGADALWHAVHEHITDMNEMDLYWPEDLDQMAEELSSLEGAYQKAVDDIVEEEFLVDDN